MTTESRGREVVEGMLARDRFSAWLGIEVVAVEAGASTCRMTVREEMVNGFGVSHGGVVFSLADSAFAFACNSYNFNTVAQGCAIEFLAPAREGDLLTAHASERSRSGRTGVYDIEVTNQDGAKIALFRGKSYRIKGHVVEPLAAD